MTYRAGKTKFVRPILGPSSLLCLDGPEHLRQRRLLLPPLHGERLAGYADLTRDIALAEAATWPLGQPFALSAAMRRITLQVILRSVFGLRRDAERQRMGAHLLALVSQATGSRTQLVRMAARRDLTAPPPARSRLARLLATADAALYGVIAERRSSGADGDDVLSMLLSARDDDGAPMSDSEVRDELMTLLLAGHETTAASLSWALERALRHSDVWETLRAEARHARSSTYTAAVVSETLRTRPVLWLAGRTLTEDRVIDGYTLPAGTLAYVCSYLLHRREDIYPDALTFRPERFLDAERGAYTFVPFGGGPRRCIGAAFAELEMRAVLAAIASTCDLRAVDAGRDERFRRRGMVVAPDRGARVVLSGRS